MNINADNIPEVMAENMRLRHALERIEDICDGDRCRYFDSKTHCCECEHKEVCIGGIVHLALVDQSVSSISK